MPIWHACTTISLRLVHLHAMSCQSILALYRYAPASIPEPPPSTGFAFLTRATLLISLSEAPVEESGPVKEGGLDNTSSRWGACKIWISQKTKRSRKLKKKKKLSLFDHQNHAKCAFFSLLSATMGQ